MVRRHERALSPPDAGVKAAAYAAAAAHIQEESDFTHFGGVGVVLVGRSSRLSFAA